MRRSLVVLALAFVLVGCGNVDGDRDSAETDTHPSAPSARSSEPSSATQPGRAEQELETAYRTYMAALLTADAATAYDLLTAGCRDKLTQSEFAAALEAAAELSGGTDYKIITVQAFGNEGIVVATNPVEALKNNALETPWLLEKGEWHSDGCSVLSR